MTYKTIGIDIGSISVSVVLLNAEREIQKYSYAAHKGKIKECLLDILKNYNSGETYRYAITSSAPPIFNGVSRYDSRICVIAAARHLHPDAGSLLLVGGEKFNLILFDNNGNYLNCRSNSSCAAGTGSFLDQQAKRLNLADIEEFSRLALDHLNGENASNIPKIASRCSVFAKTDLIHAQQEGFLPAEIAGGLCYGLAKNIVDAVFSNTAPNSPLVCCGGVSKNGAVMNYIAELTGCETVVDEYSQIYGAIGAALCLIDDKNEQHSENLISGHNIFLDIKKQKKLHYAPLELKLSKYPDFTGIKSYIFISDRFKKIPPVEVDIYENLIPGNDYNVYLGIDIGSTSTKALLLDDKKNVLAGLYTRTSGRPMEASQTVFEAIDNIMTGNNVTFTILGAATTGSGRKFIAGITGADLALDEISAHARAAYELDPDTDTIIEIGGQDSKFTTMKNGMVTFSIMNNVCAAGTGSFIEEQAEKLGVGLADFAARTEGIRSPLSSDRCTVFMERDINNFLNGGYSVDEILASVLHSVRDNYLMKVAAKSGIGEKIFFQGATAKNRALVAAFEQKLGKPIMVSRYCHLTGALGAALVLHDQGKKSTEFRGINIYQNRIPIRTEICEICTNHCKIKIADIAGDTAAFGFLCGRDYDTKQFVSADKSRFDLLKARKKVFDFKSSAPDAGPVIGIPASLNLLEDMALWKKFFDLLEVKTITSGDYTEGHKDGKIYTGAEFCSPITDLHGHVMHLLDKADFIFLPVYLEAKSKRQDTFRKYCYYTQYVPAIITSIRNIDEHKIISPIIRPASGNIFTKAQLYKTLKPVFKGKINPVNISTAYDKATAFYQSAQRKMIQIFETEFTGTSDVSVVLLGRPYTILSTTMNKGIPQVFAKNGIKAFYQDMIPRAKEETKQIEPLLKALHWKYAATIMETSEIISAKDGLYPVLITSFKCAPDSFVIEYFRQLMDSRAKPYLILQLDEHDSTVGYETRIEAAIRSFRNHLHSKTKKRTDKIFDSFSDIYINKKNSIKEKTLLLPCWDSIACRLLVSNLQFEGYDVRLLEESDDAIRKSMALNSGQCIPLSIIAGETIDYVEKYELLPEKTALWTMDSLIACNIRMFPYYFKKIFESSGREMEKLSIYAGDITFYDISTRASINAYFVYMLAGLTRKIGCKLRPYEQVKGETDRVIKKTVSILTDAFRFNRLNENTIDDIVDMFAKIPVKISRKPRVVIFGDIYVRDNEIMNQNLVRTIEENGGEVVTTPYSDLVKVIASAYIKKWFIEGHYIDMATAKVLFETVKILEKKFIAKFNRILDEPEFDFDFNPEKVLAKYNTTIYQGGETMENFLKIHYITEKYNDISLFVQTNPAFCCPSLVSQSMTDRIEEITGVPVVTIEYDGTGGFKNDTLIPYLKFPRNMEKSNDPKKQKIV